MSTQSKTAKKIAIEEERCSVIHLNAGIDTNGNARRAFLVMHPSDGVVACIKEDCYGRSALANAFGIETGSLLMVRIGAEVPTTASYIRQLLKEFPACQPSAFEITR